ncbi:MULTISPECIES: ROK family protein [unclassified Arthrobacter]|uniref:ROK family protein n=1 Tax=unclassified Arthrobacter TaxID=235627 RepID=UPI001CC7BB65|nr:MULTISPECIES: ROK family protein [unclassified Arthrobacter]MDE8586627.1 ROK family protein [Arthrobacter sp. NQ4]BCW79026.1 sugar kinase [Arthrobacter sp. NicSoilC5]
MVMPAPAAAGSGSPAPGNVGDVRRSNLALVLGAIAEFPPGTHPSRAQVAGATGLTKASVSSLVLDLLDAGVIREIGLNPQGRGRPGVGLELSPSRAVMGMEVNVDYISAAVVDLSGKVLRREVRERDNRNSPDKPVLAALAGLAARVRGAAGEQGVDVVGGGLAVPGLVDPARARVLTAPNLGWVNVDLDLYALLPETALGVALFNEANAAALAELRHRPDRAANFLFVSGEVGVGGGIVIGSELFTGPGGHAGEVGHIVVDPDGGHCSCGGTGCLETVAGQDAIFIAAGLAPDGSSRSAAMSALLQALEGGAPKAVSAVERAGRCLGIALASTARVVDIDSVVLGGHFAVLEPWLRAPLLDSLQKYAPGKYASEQVTVSAVGEFGALLGAAGSVIRSLVDAPHRLQA